MTHTPTLSRRSFVRTTAEEPRGTLAQLDAQSPWVAQHGDDRAIGERLLGNEGRTHQRAAASRGRQLGLRWQSEGTATLARDQLRHPA